jgi:hypothetical protein
MFTYPIVQLKKVNYFLVHTCDFKMQQAMVNHKSISEFWHVCLCQWWQAMEAP